MEISSIKSKTIYNDYSEKIKNKLPDSLELNDINEFIALLNFSFQHKNNFFVENFNTRVIANIYLSYNQLKTNILTENITDLFQNISKENIKLLKFIVSNFLNRFDQISTLNNETQELCEFISKNGMKRCLVLFNLILK